MKRSDRFREQHEEMVKVVGQISALSTNADKVKQNANNVRALLSQLMGSLKSHLAMEDNVLYPDLLKNSDEKVRNLATRYSSEMGGMKAAVEKYNSKWITAKNIEDNAAIFLSETKDLFNVLGKRIDRENSELYPLLDKVA
ncbi:MAG: hemerythrin domain-containing protein [Oligoflexia bacterium]|nr:hemerythrin domain-containing protein [Oligoflexia bacterium]